jgi:hypothetical protein
MSVWIANNFIVKRGLDRLFLFLEMCNKGKSLLEISRILGVSIARTQELREKLFSKHWQFQPHIEEFINSYIQTQEEILNREKERFEKNKKFNVIRFKK